MKIYEASRATGLGIYYISPLENKPICDYCTKKKCGRKELYRKNNIFPSVCTEIEIDKQKAELHKNF